MHIHVYALFQDIEEYILNPPQPFTDQLSWLDEMAGNVPMTDAHKLKLQVQHATLVDNLEVDNAVDHLFSKLVLTPAMKEEINSKQVQQVFFKFIGGEYL